MGYGYWTRDSFVNYSRARGRAVDTAGNLDGSLTDRQLYTQRALNPRLDPKNVMRECCDSDDHPFSLPVILALDVTGSMGSASAEVARKMNEVMTRLYGEVQDVEFMVMGIGDLAYDRAPIQISQFESDIRIAEQLDLVYMEHGGGGNSFESYTAAWYMGFYHTKLDCWKRGGRGLLITMGDEPLNPYLPCQPLAKATGDALQGDVETPELYRSAIEKYDIWHLHVKHTQADRYHDAVARSFGRQLEPGHLQFVDVEGISNAIVGIVADHAGRQAVSPALAAAAPGKRGGTLSRLISW